MRKANKNMKTKKYSLKVPPARPNFNREDTRFISIAELQKEDPSLIPKKEHRDVNKYIPLFALVVIGICLSFNVLFGSKYSEQNQLVGEVDSGLETGLVEVPHFTPPKYNPNQNVTYEENAPTPNLEEDSLPARVPANDQDGQFSEDNYYDEFGNNSDYNHE